MVHCARIIDSKSSILNPSYSVLLIKAKRLILSFPFQMKLKKFFIGYLYEIIRNMT